MKKTFSIAAGLLLCAFTIAGTVHAAAFSQAADGKVTVSATGVQGAKDIEFNPSSQVKMSGASVSTSFAIAAYHTQANQKKAGQQYGMAAESNALWFKDISATAVTTLSAQTTNKASAFGTGWYTM